MDALWSVSKIKHPWPVCQHFPERQQRLPSWRGPLGQRLTQWPEHWNTGRPTSLHTLYISMNMWQMFCLECSKVQFYLFFHFIHMWREFNQSLPKNQNIDILKQLTILFLTNLISGLTIISIFNMHTCKCMSTHRHSNTSSWWKHCHLKYESSHVFESFFANGDSVQSCYTLLIFWKSEKPY